MSWKRIVLAVLILILYLAAAATVVVLSYYLSPPTNADQYKEFGIRAAIALTAVGAFFGSTLALFSLNTQLKAARDLENQKKEILLAVEEIKGRMERQNDFLSRTLDVKSIAFDKLFVASNNCYRELQNLGLGIFNKESVAVCERSLAEAEGLSANLDDVDQKIVTELVQIVLNIGDMAKEIKGNAMEKKNQYIKIWEENVKTFGAVMERLRDRSLFRNAPSKI